MQNRAGAVVAAALAGPEFTERGWRLSSLVILVVALFSLTSVIFTVSTGAQATVRVLSVHLTRTSALDLEVAGDLAGLPPNSARYVTREDLLTLPQVSFAANRDANFTSPTRISGVALEELSRQLATDPNADLMLAICDDQYRAYYSRIYIAAHHPVLALKINGQSPSGWPKDAEGHNRDIGPYLISQPDFTASFKILGYSEAPQIPWGVVRLEFRDETKAFDAIAPRGPQAGDQQVQAGYGIAQQNCFRCHNMGVEGGQKAGHPWLVLSAWAAAQPNYFAAYIHNPKEKNPNAQMPSFPEYDDATLRALIAYFRTFTATTRENP